MDGKQQLQEAREKINELLKRVRGGGYFIDLDSIICDASNILIDLGNNNLVGSRADYATQRYVDEELINGFIKYNADAGDYWRIKNYLKDVTDRGAQFYIDDDGSLSDVTNDDVETRLLEIGENLSTEIRDFNS